MRMISFTIPGRIGGKMRAGRQYVGGGRVHTFNPKKTESQEKLVRDYAAQAMRRLTLFEGPIEIKIAVTRVTPSSWSKKKRGSSVWVTGKPDYDNTAKLIGDAMNGIVYADDSQIALATISRVYGLVERVIVEVSELTHEHLPRLAR